MNVLIKHDMVREYVYINKKLQEIFFSKHAFDAGDSNNKPLTN